MHLTFTKSKFDVPEGQYLAKFTGCDLLEDKPGSAPRLGQDGKPMAPGMAWRFEVVEGENTGKIADRITGRVPGPKNVCGRFLAAVSGQILKDGMTVDLSQFVGKLYRVNVVTRETGNGTCVSDMGIVRVYDSEPAPPSGPPPRNKPAEKKYWVPMGEATPLLTAAEIKDHIEHSRLSLDGEICPEGGDEYKAVSEYLPEMRSLIPF
jgi:hypothetical protein